MGNNEINKNQLYELTEGLIILNLEIKEEIFQGGYQTRNKTIK